MIEQTPLTMKSFRLAVSQIIILLISAFGFSQDQDPLLITSNTGLIFQVDMGDKTIQGSPYIIDIFQPVKVSVDVEKIFNAKYNAVTDEVEVETGKNTIQSINKMIPGIAVTFLKDNKIYKGMTYLNEERNSVTGFLIPINEENKRVKLFLKEKKIFIDRKPAKTSYEVTKLAKFERIDDSYYVAIDNEIAQPLSNKKKEVAALFQNHEKEVLNYINSERMNLKKQEDLIKLIAYINKL